MENQMEEYQEPDGTLSENFNAEFEPEPEIETEEQIQVEVEEDGEVEEVDQSSPTTAWHELCRAVESALTITPVEDPEAENLEKILDTVNGYINSEFVDMDIPKMEKMKKKISHFRNSITTLVTKFSKLAPVPFNTIESSTSD